MNSSPRESVLTGGLFCVTVAELVYSNYSSTLGVATMGEYIVFFSGVLVEVQNLYQGNLLLRVSATLYSDLMFAQVGVATIIQKFFISMAVL